MFDSRIEKYPHDTETADSLCPEGNCYIVQAGDTLYAISRFYNISMDDLIEANPCIEPGHILPGQVICIPLATPPANCPTGASIYVVQKGATFYSIAKSHKMRLSALLKANPGINPDGLLIGQSICIPIISSTFISEAYKVKLLYPYRWSKTDNNKYAGIDGFLHVSSVSGDASLEVVCSNEAYHKLKPYGAHPTFFKTTVDGHEACFIFPSTDQPMEMRSQSALIARYDKQAEVKGSHYQYLIIWTDKNHLRDIADTLEFIDE